MLASRRTLLFCSSALLLGIHFVSTDELVKRNANFTLLTEQEFEEWTLTLDSALRWDEVPVTETTTEAAQKFFSAVWKGVKCVLEHTASKRNYTFPVYRMINAHQVNYQSQDIANLDLEFVNVTNMMKPQANDSIGNITRVVVLNMNWPEARYSFQFSVLPELTDDPVQTGTIEVTLKNVLLTVELATEFDEDAKAFCVSKAGWYCDEGCSTAEARVEVNFDKTQSTLTDEEKTQLKEVVEDYFKWETYHISQILNEVESSFKTAVIEVLDSASNCELKLPNCIVL